MSFEDRFRLSAHAVITDEGGRVLQLRATYAERRWGLPGGALEPGETIHDALLRECSEELGVSVEVQHLTGVYHHRALESHAFLFRCSFQPGSRIALSSEHSEYRWFAIDELAPVQAVRVRDCLAFDGTVKSRVF